MDLRTHAAMDRPVHPVAPLRDSARGRATEAAPNTRPSRGRRQRGAALALLASFLGGGLWLPTSAQAAQGPRVQVPQTTTPTSTTSPAFGTITCPPGSQLQSTPPIEDCYPSLPVDCVSFEDGFWIDRPLALNKFDPSLGSLRRVRLDHEIEVQGFFCYDNSSNKCCFGGANVGSTAQLEPNNLLNSPPLAQLPVSSVDVAFSITNIVLGPANGQFDCFIPNPGTPTDGTCAGGDYGVTNFQATGNLPPVVIEDPAELAKWVASGANNQAFFLSNIQPLIENFFACNVSTNLDTEARVKLRVTYEYCTNAPPICIGEGAPVVTAEDTPVDVFLLDRVADIDGCLDCSTFQITSQPSHGTLSGLLGCTGQGGSFAGCNDCGQCRVVYTPASNYCGPDQFTFTVRDDDGAQVSCTVLLQVTPVNDPPVCTKASFPMLEDTFLDIDLCALSSDVDGLNGCGFPLACNAFVIVNQPSCGGTLAHLGNGVYRFTPPANFCGSCSFTYRAADSGGRLSEPCTVNITVNQVNDPPICTNASFSTAEDTPLLLDLCALVTDPDNANGCGDVFNCNIQIVQQPTCGTLTPQGNGTFLFTPNANFCGQCTFTYRALDAGNRQSGVCTVTLTVTPVNDPPVCTGTTVTTAEDTSVLIDFSGLVTDVDNPPNGCGGAWTCGIEIVSPPSCGTLTEVSCAVWRFTPSANFCGQCTFTYRARDAASRGSNVCTVTVVVSGVNDPPVCVGTTVTTNEDQPVVIDFSLLVSDIDNSTPGCGDPWSCGIEIVSPPSCGTLTEIGCALWQFTPNPNFCGQCTFTFRARDEGGIASTICTVTLVVTAVNDPPVCVGTSVTTDQGTPLLIDLAPLVSDVDNPPNGCGSPWTCEIVIVSPPTCGTLIPVAGCAVFQFNPSPSFCGSCSFTFRARDAQGRLSEICTVNITVNSVNLPPVAVDDFAVTDKNVPVEIAVCVNDSDPNDGTGCGDPLDCCSITYLGDVSCPGAIVEKIVDGGTCKFRFTPPPDFVGTCTFTYRICDTGTLPLCDEAVVTIEIVERCDPTGLRQPGSLLLYPEFDNRNGIVTVYTITNTSRTQDIRVKFWYVDKEDCSTFDRTNYLTALDTLTLVTNFHNPQQEQGFCYVVAQCASGSTKPVVFNHLAGQMHVLDGIENFGFSINALAFPGIGEGGGMSACGLRFTDVNNNNLYDLDGIEYGPAPDEILIPRFFGQDQDYNSELILIGLSGGKQFTTIVDFLVYNDNEQVFSADFTFYCWTRVNLLSISNIFTADFLRNYTSHDPNEVLGDPSIETGWMRIKGALANSVNTTILNPAIYAVLIERTGHLFEVSDLPWGRCSRETGSLLPKTNSGQ